ncbi:unnamed protein product [Parajaminaea phylloscopi]
MVCGYQDNTATSQPCPFRTDSSFGLLLHRADRHLIYPPGGKEELDRLDPLLIEERKEADRRRKKAKGPSQSGEAQVVDAETAVMNTIPGLNIALSTPELIQQWIAERKKRWPSDKVVQKKLDEGWDDASRGQLSRQRRLANSSTADVSAPIDSMNESLGKRKRTSASVGATGTQGKGSEHDSSSDSDSDDSDASDAPSEEPIGKEESDVVPAGAASGTMPEEVSSKAPASMSQRATSTIVCRYFLQGRCNFGSQCKQSHADPSQPADQSQTAGPSRAAPASHVPANRRPRPRAPPPNPFEPRNLLHALLKNEIGKHLSSVAQVIRFLVRNDFLQNVELQPGDAEEQSRRRNLVQALPQEESGSGPAIAEASGSASGICLSRQDGQEGQAVPAAPTALPEPEGLDVPLEEGAYATMASSTAANEGAGSSRALYRPPSPTLRPLTALQWPPEPDPLIFLDPLRRDDPKPLTRQQFEALTFDWDLRRLLGSSGHGGHDDADDTLGPIRPGLKRALTTLDALPTDEHRRAALELILGVSLQTPLHPHQVGNTFVSPSQQQQSGGGGRFIGEVELFRLGLRVGPTEQVDLRKLAQRVSDIVDGSPEFDVEPQGWDASDEGRTFREEKRRKHWEKEADRRDMLRKLGIEVD